MIVLEWGVELEDKGNETVAWRWKVAYSVSVYDMFFPATPGKICTIKEKKKKKSKPYKLTKTGSNL